METRPSVRGFSSRRLFRDVWSQRQEWRRSAFRDRQVLIDAFRNQPPWLVCGLLHGHTQSTRWLARDVVPVLFRSCAISPRGRSRFHQAWQCRKSGYPACSSVVLPELPARSRLLSRWRLRVPEPEGEEFSRIGFVLDYQQSHSLEARNRFCNAFRPPCLTLSLCLHRQEHRKGCAVSFSEALDHDVAAMQLNDVTNDRQSNS